MFTLAERSICPEEFHVPVEIQFDVLLVQPLFHHEGQDFAVTELKVLALIRDAMLSREIKVDLESGGCYKRPAIYRDSEALMDNCAMMNRIRNVVITQMIAAITPVKTIRVIIALLFLPPVVVLLIVLPSLFSLYPLYKIH